MGFCHLFASFMFRLTVLLMTISYSYGISCSLLTNATFQVTPLWNMVNNFTQSCFVNKSINGFVFQGNMHHNCSLQILTFQDHLITIEIPEDTKADILLYIERLGKSFECQSKYVLFHGQSKGYTALFMHNHLQLNLFGNVSVLIKQVTLKRYTFVCMPGKCHKFR